MKNGPIGRKNFEPSEKQELQNILAVLAVLVALLVFAPHAAVNTADSVEKTLPQTSSFAPFWDDADFAPASSLATDTERDGAVYSYSVIPGGAANPQKLQAAIQRDPVVAAHFADFRVARVHVVRLVNERKVHVSYRLGDRIFWTKNEVTLHAGETLLSDGEHMARTRCGNRVAEVPAGPISPAEPPAEVINSPVFPHPPIATTDSLPSAPIWSDEAIPTMLAFRGFPPTDVPAAGNTPNFPILPVPPCCASSGNPSSGAPHVPPPPVQPPPGLPIPQPTPPSGGSSSPEPPATTPTPPGSTSTAPTAPATPLPSGSTAPSTPPSIPPPPPSSGSSTPPSLPPGTPTPGATPSGLIPPTTQPAVTTPLPPPPSSSIYIPTPPLEPFPVPPLQPVATPEPSSLLLLVVGLAGAVILVKTRRF